MGEARKGACRDEESVAGAGYVGLPVALLLAQRNEVALLDVVPGKVETIGRGRGSPIRDAEVERFLESREEMGLCFEATADMTEAYGDAELVVVATPTNYDADTNSFDTSAAEAAMDAVRAVNPDARRNVERLSVPYASHCQFWQLYHAVIKRIRSK